MFALALAVRKAQERREREQRYDKSSYVHFASFVAGSDAQAGNPDQLGQHRTPIDSTCANRNFKPYTRPEIRLRRFSVAVEDDGGCGDHRRARAARLEARDLRALCRACARAPTRAAAWKMWRRTRDRLFSDHPQSPLLPEQRAGFGGLAHHAYDPDARVTADVVPTAPRVFDIETSTGPPYRFRRFATRAVRRSPGDDLELPLYWLEGYGGGVFLPFADATSGGSDLRRRPLSARHGQGRRPRPATTAGSCSTSTSPTTPPAPTTRPGRARWRRPRAASPCRSGRASGSSRADARPPPAGGRRTRILRAVPLYRLADDLPRSARRRAGGLVRRVGRRRRGGLARRRATWRARAAVVATFDPTPCSTTARAGRCWTSRTGGSSELSWPELSIHHTRVGRTRPADLLRGRARPALAGARRRRRRAWSPGSASRSGSASAPCPGRWRTRGRCPSW